jgi:hypothetical protein
MSKDKVTEINEEEDFGFTFVDGETLTDASEVEDLKRRVHELKTMFLPLLQNLNKNPEKDMIKWPNRKELLDKQIKKLLELTNI